MRKTLGIVGGLVFLYIGIYLFLGITSNNMSLKINNIVDKTFASIKVFEDSANQAEYDNGNSNLYSNKWSSPSFPNGSYKNVSVIYGNETVQAPKTIQTSVSYITIDSH